MTTQSAQHTPGPWLIEHCLGTGDQDCGYEIFGVMVDFSTAAVSVASTTPSTIGGITKEERDANASLIAAAPDLLAALQALLLRSELSDFTLNRYDMSLDAQAVMQARAAIRKATGAQS